MKYERILNLYRFPRKIRFRWRNRKREKETLNLITTLEERYLQAQKYKSEPHSLFFNSALFNALSEQEISSFSRAIYLADTEQERHFHAKHLAVLLCEISEDYTELLGKHYLSALQKLGIEASDLKDLEEIKDVVRAFRKKHEKFLRRVREYIGAHRDHLGTEQLQVSRSFVAMDVYRLAGEFSVVIRRLLDFSIRVQPIVDSPRAVIRNISSAHS